MTRGTISKRAFLQAISNGKIELNTDVRNYVGHDGTAEVTRYPTHTGRGHRQNLIITGFFTPPRKPNLAQKNN